MTGNFTVMLRSSIVIFLELLSSFEKAQTVRPFKRLRGAE
jgi:hypothetical protein